AFMKLGMNHSKCGKHSLNPGTGGSGTQQLVDKGEQSVKLANYEKNVNRQMHKYNAYRKAAGTIAKYPTRITSGQEAKNPAHAHKLVSEGITSVEDLRKNIDKLNHQQQIGLKHFEDFEKRIPRDEMEQLEKFVMKTVDALEPLYKASVCGSYRRGAANSGDIDILLTHPNFTSTSGKKPSLLKAVISKLEESNFITDHLSHGDTKYMGVCKLPREKDGTEHCYRRIDIRLIPHDQFFCALLYFTGSDQFNKAMRTKALDEGFTLNEYCIRPMGSTGVPGEPLPVASEQDVFDYVGMKYKEPSERSM
ncbi:hypothetical protein LSH36_386g00004, partial [Paralvinella palmiformis]